MDTEPGQEVEVAQKVNPAPRINLLLDALCTAPTRYKAALIVARLHAVLSPLRKGDATFEAEWQKLLGGHFIEIVSSPDAWLDLEWRHVWAAQELLQDLMERHGMGFQAILPNAIEQEITEALARAREHTRRALQAEKLALQGAKA